LIAVILFGFNALNSSSIDPDAIDFLKTSLFASILQALPVALISTFFARQISLSVIRLRDRGQFRGAKILEKMPFIAAMTPGIILAFGMQLLLHSSFFASEQDPVFFIIACHSILSLPVATGVLLPHFERNISPLTSIRFWIGIPPFAWLSKVELPATARAIGIAFLITFSFSINETAVSAMLRSADNPVLSTAILQLASHYQFDSAAVGSLFILMLTSLVVILGILFLGAHEQHV
jgi:thiamine transport system permease protein